MKNIVVTGGCGFIGSNFIRYLFSEDGKGRVVNLDYLTYAGNPLNLADIEEKYGVKNGKTEGRYIFIRGDIRDAETVDRIFKEYHIDSVVHFAAESHVDRSIHGPAEFIGTNILGTFTLLEAARKFWLPAGGGPVQRTPDSGHPSANNSSRVPTTSRFSSTSRRRT